MMKLNHLLGDETAAKLAHTGLHKIAAARLRAEGHSVPEELDLRSAIQALGTNLFVKNAEYKLILDGIIAAHELTRG